MPRYTAFANDGTILAFGTDHAIGYFLDKFGEPNDKEPPTISWSTFSDGLTAKKLVELLDVMMTASEKSRLKHVIDPLRPGKMIIPSKGSALEVLGDAYKGATRHETDVDVWYGCRNNEWGWQISRANAGVPEGVEPVYYIAGFDRNGEGTYGDDFEKLFGDWQPLG